MVVQCINNMKSCICPNKCKQIILIFELLKSFKTVMFAPRCFGLHKPSSGSYSLRFAKVTILIGMYKSLLKYSVLYKHNASFDNTTLYLYTIKSYICQGNMFRRYKVIMRPSKKTDPRAVLYFTAFWSPTLMMTFWL